MGVTYAEWKATCEMALDMLCRLLERAYTSPEVMEFMSNHDIDTTVQKNFPVIDVWQVDAHILAFLSVSSLQSGLFNCLRLNSQRGGVCVNWRIVSAIRRALDPTGYWYVNETGNLLITKMKVKNIKLKDTKKDEGAHEDKDQDEDKSETRQDLAVNLPLPELQPRYSLVWFYQLAAQVTRPSERFSLE